MYVIVLPEGEERERDMRQYGGKFCANLKNIFKLE